VREAVIAGALRSPLGRPLGCSGARLVATLVHELPERGDVRHLLATMCIGVGQGIAMVLERA
jgi:acetyl-CoA acetyltransferase